MLDIVNIFYILTIMLILKKYYKIGDLYFLLLLVHLYIIFYLNNFLFPVDYMSDQWGYLESAVFLRDLVFDFPASRNVFTASAIFAAFPLPFIDTVYSISMINYLMYVGLFIFMINKKMFNNRIMIFFYLLYPSLLLYSSLALRDFIVFTVMFFVVYFLFVSKQKLYIRTICFVVLMVLLFLVKKQNAGIALISIGSLLIVYALIKYPKYRLIISIFLVASIYYVDQHTTLLGYLDLVRLQFYSEIMRTDLGMEYYSVDNVYSILKIAIPSMLIYFFRPLPWQEFGVLQSVQFLENIVLFLMIIYIILLKYKNKLFKNKEIIFINIFLFMGILIYSLVMVNSGTAVRYKFPFVAVYIIYSLYFIYRSKVCSKDKV